MRGLMILLSAALGWAAVAGADEPQKTFQVVTPRDIDIIATGINEKGEVVGFDLVEEKARPGVIDQVPCFIRGKEVIHLPRLEGYTATFPAAISDGGWVVGHVAKPISSGRRQHLSTQAFIWDARSGIRGLGVVEGDSASHASGVTRDGRRISGYSIGDNRMRACVWDRDGDRWRAAPLPHDGRLGGPTVPISGDGRFVAGVVGAVPCLWTLDRAGRWSRESIGDPGSLIPRAVNNAGTVVGLQHTPDGSPHAVAWSRSDGLRRLTEPAGYVRSEALAINNRGVIVGMLDGPHGSNVGPDAFAEEGGRMRVLKEGGPNFASATAINDRGQVTGVFEEREDGVPPAAPKR